MTSFKKINKFGNWKFYFENGILKIKFGNWNFGKLNLRIGTLENYFENEILENLKNWSFGNLFENGSLKKIIWKLKFWKLNSKIGILKIKKKLEFWKLF